MNISLMGRFDKNWELGNGKKIGILMFQKVVKTGNIGKKVQWQTILITYHSSLSTLTLHHTLDR